MSGPFASPVAAYYENLMKAGSFVLREAVRDVARLATAHQAIHDLASWSEALAPRPEAGVLWLRDQRG